MKKIINTKIPKESFNLESGVIRNSTINPKSRIRIAGDKTEIDNTQLEGHINILRDSVVKDSKISGHPCDISESPIATLSENAASPVV